jgi:hypothetical protein
MGSVQLISQLLVALLQEATLFVTCQVSSATAVRYSLGCADHVDASEADHLLYLSDPSAAGN